jgi:hypothetical protein
MVSSGIGEIGTTLAVTSNLRTLRRNFAAFRFVPISPILVTLMKEALSSSKTSILTRAIRRKIPEDTILEEDKICGAFRTLVEEEKCILRACRLTERKKNTVKTKA